MTIQGINHLTERKNKALERALKYNNIYTVLYGKALKNAKGTKAKQSLRDYIFWSECLCSAMNEIITIGKER